MLRLGDLSEHLLLIAGKVFFGTILEDGFFKNDEFWMSGRVFDILEDSKNTLNGKTKGKGKSKK